MTSMIFHRQTKYQPVLDRSIRGVAPSRGISRMDTLYRGWGRLPRCGTHSLRLCRQSAGGSSRDWPRRDRQRNGYVRRNAEKWILTWAKEGLERGWKQSGGVSKATRWLCVGSDTVHIRADVVGMSVGAPIVIGLLDVESTGAVGSRIPRGDGARQLPDPYWEFVSQHLSTGKSSC